MSSGYHRRSRQGCTTCRAARIKCDERKPRCETCRHRKVACAGYAQRLKWIDQSDGASQKAKNRSPCSTTSSLSIPKSPRVGPAFRSQTDVYILEHWNVNMPILSLVDPGAHSRIQDCQRGLLWDPESILLPAILAHGALHLASRQLFSKVEAIQKRQAALEAMTRSIPGILGRRKWLSLSFVSTSLTLSAMELTIGGDTAAILPHLHATSNHIMNASALEQSISTQIAEDDLLRMRITQMCYFDTMCCVPCARKPLIPRTFWNDTILPFLEGQTKNHQPDLFFGYGCRIFPLIGEAAALVEALFESQVTVAVFASSRDELISHLAKEIRGVPQTIAYQAPINKSENSSRLQNHNGCVLAAWAHATATQIFLLRADATSTGPAERRCEIARRVTELHDLVFSVPPFLNAATMMLWPLFVLGCETRAGDARDEFVQLLDSMLAERWFLNIESTLKSLRTQIWTLNFQDQEKWAWHCWRSRISLCLA